MANPTKKLVRGMKKQEREARTPIATEMYLPNHSGDHSRGRVLTTPTTDLEIANKKYVDDQIAAIPATTPAGSDNEVQFNDNGSFGADANLTWDGNTLKNVGDTNNPILFHADINNTNVIGFQALDWNASNRIGFNARGVAGRALANVGDAGKSANFFGNDINGGITCFRGKPFNNTTKCFWAERGHLILDDGLIGVKTDAPVTEVDINGGFAANLTSQTGTYTALTTDHTIICGAGNETFTVTLPAVAGVSGIIFNIKNVGTGTITVDGASAETIDGSATAVISTQHASISIQCDGTEWWII